MFPSGKAFARMDPNLTPQRRIILFASGRTRPQQRIYKVGIQANVTAD
jgi:hypothetical protein